MTKQLIKYGAAVMTTVLALVVLWQFRIVVIYVMISLMLAATLRPLVNRLAGRKFIVRAAWILVYLIVLASFGYVLVLAGQNAIKEIQALAQSMAVQDKWALPIWLQGTTFDRSLISRLPPPSIIFQAAVGNQGQLVLPTLLGFAQGIGGLVSGLVIIFFLSIYWSLSQVHFERLWLSLLPSAERKQARGVWRVVEPDLGGYIRSQVIQSILAGLFLGLGYWLLGSPYPSLLGLVGALACLIPVVGAALVVLPPLLIGLLTSVQLSLFTGIYALIVMIALIVWIRPRLFNRKWDNPILTIILMLALADAFGIIGIIFAPPLSVVCQILWRRLVSHRRAPGAAALISDLQVRQEHILETIQAMEEPPPPLVASSMERLAQLIEKADPIIQTVSQSDLGD